MKKITKKNRVTLSLLFLALLTTGCEVSGTTEISGDGTIHVDEGTYNLLNHSFRNDLGTIEFRDAGSNAVQLMSTCNQGDLRCNSMNHETISEFMVKLNDSRSYHSRQVNQEYWDTWVSGSGEQLTVITKVRDWSGAQTRTVRESFRITDSPCGYGLGRGLEARMLIDYGASYDSVNASRTCQAYY